MWIRIRNPGSSVSDPDPSADTQTLLFALGILVDPDVLDPYQLASWIRILIRYYELRIRILTVYQKFKKFKKKVHMDTVTFNDLLPT